MPEENIAAVRAIYAKWEQGDWSAVDWADPEIEYSAPDSPEPDGVKGREAMGEAWGRWLREWNAFRAEAEEYLDYGDTVVVLTRFGGKGKQSGAAADGQPGAAAFRLRDGKVVRLAVYNDRARALAELREP